MTQALGGLQAFSGLAIRPLGHTDVLGIEFTRPSLRLSPVKANCGSATEPERTAHSFSLPRLSFAGLSALFALSVMLSLSTTALANIWA